MLSNGMFQTEITKVYVSSAAEASAVVTTSKAFLLYAVMANANAAARYFQLFNSTSVPADTTVPYMVPFRTANANLTLLNLGNYPAYFSTGISICNSTTQNTKTVGSADCMYAVFYKNVDI